MKMISWPCARFARKLHVNACIVCCLDTLVCEQIPVIFDFTMSFYCKPSMVVVVCV